MLIIKKVSNVSVVRFNTAVMGSDRMKAHVWTEHGTIVYRG